MTPAFRIGIAIVLTLAAASCAPTAPRNVTTAPQMLSSIGTSALREQTADEQVSHVLSRLTFGARPGDVQQLRDTGVDRWIDAQLHPDAINDTRSEQFFASYETHSTSAADLQRKYPPPNQLLNRLNARGDRSKLTAADSAVLQEATAGVRRMTAEIQSGRVARALLSERQLQEVMTDFWLNHFTVYIQKYPQERYQLADYENRTVRPNALGKFRTLLGHRPRWL